MSTKPGEPAKSRLESTLRREGPVADFIVGAYRDCVLELKSRFPEAARGGKNQEIEEALRGALPADLWHNLKNLRILRNRIDHEGAEPTAGDRDISIGTIKKLAAFLGVAIEPEREAGSPGNSGVKRNWQAFQERARRFFEQELRCQLRPEVTVVEGDGQRHRFDFAANDSSALVECKSYTWTKSGNNPSAKMNQAKSDAQALKAAGARRKILAFEDDVNAKGQSLAEVFAHRNDRWLADVEIWREFDGKFECVRPSETSGS